MARAETITKLSLDRWFALMQINPLHANGVYVGESAICDKPWYQFAWQSADRIGREEVAQAIADAEADLEGYLRYRLLPSWEVNEWQETVRPVRKDLFNLTSTDIRGFAQTVQANWGYLVSGGIRQKDSLELAAAIDYSDDDGDGYDEVATVTGGVTVAAGTPACEVHVYFPGHSGEDQWEIRPINVRVAGTTATITFRREQCVLPELQLDIVPPEDDSHMRGVDGLVDGNFEDTVDVYRVYNDPQTQVTLLWEGLGTGCACNGAGCNLCAYTAQTGCLNGRGESRQSIVAYRPADWNATTLQFDSAALSVERQPDIVRLYYYAGWRNMNLTCPTIQMDPKWERIVAYFAAARLDRPLCECTRSVFEKWSRDLAVTGEDAGSFAVQVSPADLDNPFGTTRGAINAWRRVNREGTKIGRAVHV